MSASIGIDVGGTWARAAIVDSRNLWTSRRFRTSTKGWNTDRFQTWVIEVNAQCAGTASIPLGVAIPGVIDAGVVKRSVNLAWLENFDIIELIGRSIGRRPFLMTDADAATWGEYVEAGRPIEPFLHLRLGTGVGCGVVKDGKLVPTDPQRTTHWPALIVDERREAPLCPCGLRGCLEQYVGGAALERRAGSIGLQQISQLAGNTRGITTVAAQAILDEAAAATARAIKNLEGRFGVRVVILEGGVLSEIPDLIGAIQQAAAGLQVSAAICKGRLADWAGVIGAATLALDAERNVDSLVAGE